MNVRAGDLAVVINGLWPNVGRVVFVDRYVEAHDFSAMGLGTRPGWRVRSYSEQPLETVAGPRMVGFSPEGSLRPLDPLPSEMALQLQRRMAVADFKEAMAELAGVLAKQERVHKRRVRTDRKARKPAAALAHGIQLPTQAFE